MSFELQLAAASDADEMSHVMDKAFQNDRHTMVKDLLRTGASTAEGMRDALLSWTNDSSRATVIKAVEPLSDRILGWICWSHSDASAETSSDFHDDLEGEHGPDSLIQSYDESPSLASLEELERITNEDMAAWQAEVMPAGIQCWFIVAIAVLPEAQSQGIGSALISWGTSRADADGVFCWVHSSDEGHHAFQRAGFEELGSLTVNLDAYAPNPQQATGGPIVWGPYTFHRMRRPASTGLQPDGEPETPFSAPSSSHHHRGQRSS